MRDFNQTEQGLINSGHAIDAVKAYKKDTGISIGGVARKLDDYRRGKRKLDQRCLSNLNRGLNKWMNTKFH